MNHVFRFLVSIGQLVAALLVLGWLVNTFMPRDTTDPEGGRSGMTVYTDSASGWT